MALLNYWFFKGNINIAYFVVGLLAVYFIIHFLILNRFGFNEEDLMIKNTKGLLFASSILFIFLSVGALIPFVQDYNRNSQIQLLSKIKDYGKDENISTGTFGTLKTKYENGKLYYQVNLNIPKKQLDSVADYSIQLLDMDGFVIKDFNLLKSNNISYEEKVDVFNVNINDNLKFTVKDYERIAKWELLGVRQ